ncbi:MAG: electron transport complex subunit RsxC [Rikenellaceae bacterium]|jgi:electron transport complex protein RnfC|nr:electron transport complex subunit RsxC [Rikenellaceae bacterium]
MSKTFKIGGIHPSDSKLSRGAAIEVFGLPQTVTIPVAQHIGAPAVTCVAKGDQVKTGQVIATAAGFVSSNIHSSVSGVVTSVDDVPDAGGMRRKAVTIQVEGDQWAEGIDRSDKLMSSVTLSAKEIVEKITAAGIVGMGGATFPTHVKLSIPPGKKAECLIINGVECEPYLTSDHRVMLERSEELLVGVQILCKALGVEKAYIGIEKNKPDAIAHLKGLVSKYPGVEVVPLKVQYPQGGEKQLIDAVVGRQVPSGALPIEVGAVVQNVGTALAVYEAVQKNKPLIERVVTVTGKSVKTPANYLVRIGTPIEALIERSGGVPDDCEKIVNGGPMMGRALSNPTAPVTKGTSGILLMRTKEARRPAATTCISCAKCVAVCPMGLEPYLIYKLACKTMLAEAEEHRATDCIECGSCSYACPAALPLLDRIRLAKAGVMKIARERAIKQK